MTGAPVQTTRLYYVHDPMCSWCWGFRPAWLDLRAHLPQDVELITWVGGLAPDSDQPMDPALRDQLQATWGRIAQKIPGTQFNFDFWTLNTPRRSTYPACRAAIAARQMADLEAEMTYAIQQAYYLKARNPSDLDTLTTCANEIGLDEQGFVTRMASQRLQEDFIHELHQVRAIGVNSFPSLVLEIGPAHFNVPIHYTSADAMLDDIRGLMAQSHTHS